MDNQQKYLSGEKDATLFFYTFFSMCHKFKIDYEKANPKEKEFIDEMTRYNYELKKAKRDGLSTEKIEKPFPIEDGTLSEKLGEFFGRYAVDRLFGYPYNIGKGRRQ